ncbi:phospholipid-translocating ATPase rsb1 [Yamadazyma tenuis]|uniref:Sphingoid long-chain base transporter RSB1 n=1 Tax=Candida tenuis (strain ATCC 10573 / BCRC 21748 / CBS 615 / JCM 9827 / NBRC 10315 / NRRL Y-1498 / VKM Y-70) TaxID=590646 RepID=G3B2C2_CANTC|nr:RTA1-domain-containing protein [Yamadazyma tenuis ATCC 10573]EGV64642.1 RTA1-domain-containing protein [Yamadazyma tenuis ATCC 10573]WEJ97424.1 phospholipid-translocating ATPase rsb1 [Yamadazyma tenuis]
MDLSDFSYVQWEPSTLASSITAWTSVNPAHTSGLEATLNSVISALPTATGYLDLVSYSQIYRGAEASMAVISAQEVLATATNSAVMAEASQAIFNNTLNLKKLDMDMNLYKYHLSVPANSIYFAIFTLVFLYVAGMSVISKYYWYNVTYICGYGLEFCGWLGRILAINDTSNNNFFILQFVALTLAPAFIMAGIYFLFAQMVVIHGREYSLLKPLWYSYFFISTDVLSLLVQAGGGASASIASKRHKNTKPGTDTIICGIVIQTVAMTVFLGFWFEFLNRVFFRHSGDVTVDSSFKKKSVKNFFKLLFNVKSTRAYKQDQLDPFYNPRFQHIRNSKLFGYMPLVITITVVVIYIRCIYRVVELSEGWRGYLITHEVYIMVLDALMVAIAGLVAIPFHPVWTLGRENVVRLATIRKRHDESSENQDELTSLQYSSNEAPVEKTVTAEKGITEVVLNKADNEVIADKK